MPINRAMSVNRQSVVPCSRMTDKAFVLISSIVAARARSRRLTTGVPTTRTSSIAPSTELIA
jgi:hypothetical protein